MMLPPYPEVQQDSTQAKQIQIRDTLSLKSDSASISRNFHSTDSVPRRTKTLETKSIPEITDTVSVCRRNTIEDVTFYDPNNLVSRIELPHRDAFPFLFTAKGRVIQEEAKASLVKHLRAGEEIPSRPLHDDWIILIILFSTFLFTIIRKSSDTLFQGVERSFLFRGATSSGPRDIGGIFTLESTIKNLISFLMLGLFGYSAASYYNVIPSATGGIIFWLISVLIIIAAVSLRHLVCIVTGFASGERELFAEYLHGIYQFYRLSALLISVVIILISYSTIFPLESYFIAGAIVLGTLYLIRVIRLFIIFINKNISLFYLILYLCALEILPVVISVKYFSGLT
jgi:hypothetical protein